MIDLLIISAIFSTENSHSDSALSLHSAQLYLRHDWPILIWKKPLHQRVQVKKNRAQKIFSGKNVSTNKSESEEKEKERERKRNIFDKTFCSS
jgi:hypothetical protein